MLFRNRCNNHCAYNPYLSSIHEKLATNIQKSYSITLPLWTLRFNARLFLSALGYATCNHKGEVKGVKINDISALILVPNDSRAQTCI